MKQFRSTLILLIVAIVFGGYLYWRERGPAAEAGNTVLLRTDPDAVTQVKISQPNSALTLIQKNGNWQVQNEQKKVPADADSVKTLLDKLQLVQSGAIVNSPGKLSEYGLEGSQNSIAVNNARLIFGDSPSFDNSKVYVQVKDGGKSTIALLPVDLRDDALKTFANWRDKAVLRFDDTKVTQLQIVAPRITATFSSQKKKDETAWKIAAPISAKATSSTVQSFLTSLKNAQTTNFLDDAAKDLRQWKLDKPQATVKVTTPDGIDVLKIGKAVSGGYAAQNSLSKSVFVLPTVTYDLINRALSEWRDKDILALDAAKVTQMKISARGKNITLNLSGSNWIASNVKLDKATVSNAASDMFVGLQGLQAKDFIDAPKSDDTYGLNKPALEVALTSSQWQGIRTIQLATHEGKYYARLQGAGVRGKTVYVLPDQALDAFSGALDHLLGKAKKAS